MRRKPRQVPHDLGEPHDRQVLGVEPGIAARRAHGRPGNADELQVGTHGRAAPDEAGTELVARSLAGDDGDTRLAAIGVTGASARCCVPSDRELDDRP